MTRLSRSVKCTQLEVIRVEDMRTIKQRYARISNSCKECKAYRPRTKQQCKIYKLLLQEMQPDLVKNEKCFIADGIACKGFTWK